VDRFKLAFRLPFKKIMYYIVNLRQYLLPWQFYVNQDSFEKVTT